MQGSAIIFLSAEASEDLAQARKRVSLPTAEPPRESVSHLIAKYRRPLDTLGALAATAEFRADSGQPSFIEEHYTPKDLAAAWKVSPDTVVRWFSDEPGVLKLGTPSRRGTRTRVELRIPRSVAERVYSERTR